MPTASATAIALTHCGVPSPARPTRRRIGSPRISRAASEPDGGDEHVARAGGEEVRDVEAARAADQRRDALLEQQALEHLGLGLVARPGDPHQRALGVAAGAPCGRARRLGSAAPRPLLAGEHEREPAVAAEALVRSCAAAHDGHTSGALTSVSHPDLERGLGRPRRRRSATRRTSGSSPFTPTIRYSASG